MDARPGGAAVNPLLPARGRFSQCDIASLTPGGLLKHLLTGWRKQLPPQPAAARKRGRRYPSQEWVARRIGVAPRWFAALERGEVETNNFSHDLVDKVATFYRLDDYWRGIVHRLACGTEPPVTPQPHPTQRIVDSDISAILACYPWPAYVTDETWQLLAYNDAALAWFPYMATESNLMKWMLCDPGARRLMLDWEKVHAPLMLAQLRSQFAAMPNSPALIELILDIWACNPQTLRMWKSQPTVMAVQFAEPRRLLAAGACEPTIVSVRSMMVVSQPLWRITHVVPVGGCIPARSATASPGQAPQI